MGVLAYGRPGLSLRGSFTLVLWSKVKMHGWWVWTEQLAGSAPQGAHVPLARKCYVGAHLCASDRTRVRIGIGNQNLTMQSAWFFMKSFKLAMKYQGLFNALAVMTC